MNARFMRTSLLATATLAGAIACNPSADDALGDAGSAPGVRAARADSRESGGFFNFLERSPTHELPAGTRISVRLTDTIDSETASVGQDVRASVSSRVSVGGDVVIPVGAVVRGEVAEVKSAKRFGGQALIAVVFTEIETPDGTDVPVTGRIQDLGKKQVGKDTATIAGSAAGGAILGEILDDKPVEGAIVGGGIGTAVASRKGEEAVLSAGQEIVVETTRVVRLKATSDT